MTDDKELYEEIDRIAKLGAERLLERSRRRHAERLALDEDDEAALRRLFGTASGPQAPGRDRDPDGADDERRGEDETAG